MRRIEDKACFRDLLAVMDTLELISGKWRVPIMALLAHHAYRFGELASALGISARMLSRELETLEERGLVSRKLDRHGNETAWYLLSEEGHSLREVIREMKLWGEAYRQKNLHR
ncbi:MAG TPA: helix-turn-helix domain-containing protein [Flavisolibacter sp.]|nr:helix-turn-helix domain-containing protein [Flavisolibacter sp.]